MKITRFSAVPISIPLKKPFALSLDKGDRKDHLVVVLETDEGITGYGEVGVRAALIGGPVESLCPVVERYLAPHLLGRDPFDLEGNVQLMDKAVRGFLFAKAAMDIALHDVCAKSLGIPMNRLFGGAVRQQISVTGVVGIESEKDTVSEAVQKVQEGYSCLKLKVGKEPRSDVERVRAVRKAVGDAVRIRIDANQGYSVREALDVSRRLENSDIQCFEQPLHSENIEGHAFMARHSAIPIMLDESVCTLRDALRAVSFQAVDIINIKISRVGGIL